MDTTKSLAKFRGTFRYYRSRLWQCGLTACVVLISVRITAASQPDHPMWPLPPDKPKVEYLGEIFCEDLDLKSGFFGKLKRFIAGASEIEKISLPFDVLVSGRTMFMTCQNIPYLISVDLDELKYNVYTSDKLPFKYPIGLCGGKNGEIYITDSENATVYRFSNGKVEPFISDRLLRPTGISANKSLQRLMVIDTGDHSLKLFDFDGNFIKMSGGKAGGDSGFNFPTFAAANGKGGILVNDALNYRIKRFDWDGNFISAFGAEGDGPGAFSRPKGIAVDSEDHIYVVDNLFDNIQVFDDSGKLLLVIGSGGRKMGEFWSPSGIDIANDTIYIADTFNNRVQILRYLGKGTR
ncbi:MAG: 6-bladed beta-propeller [candidate division Zixibacteria bacterium]